MTVALPVLSRSDMLYYGLTFAQHLTAVLEVARGLLQSNGNQEGAEQKRQKQNVWIWNANQKNLNITSACVARRTSDDIPRP